MGDFNKKQALGIGGILTGAAIIAVLANISEIIQLFRHDEPAMETSTTSIVETVEKNTKAKETKQAEETIIETENIEEVVEEVPETEPPTEPQPKAVYLDSLKVIESNNYFENENNAIDTIGNTYMNHLLVIGGGSNNRKLEGYATYYLGGNYKTLSGTIAIHDETDIDINSIVSILCDDNVVYTINQEGRTFIPEQFSVNVENCQWLKIYQVHYTRGTGAGFILHNWKLEE